MHPPNLITFDQAAVQLALTESDLDDLIDAGKLTTQPYLGDVYLLTDQVAALTKAQPATDQPVPKPRPAPDDAKLARIHDLQATRVREVRAAQARELLGIGESNMSHLGNEGRENYEVRKGRRWYLLEDIETYARLQNVWASKSGGWTPYGKQDARESYLDLKLTAPAKPRPSVAQSIPRADDNRIDSKHAAEIIGVCLEQFFRLARNHGLKVEYAIRPLPGRDKLWGRPMARRINTYSAQEVFALADKREQKRSQSCISPTDWNERMVKPIIRTKIEAPPGDILLTRQEAAAFLGISLGNVSNLVTAGRLFGWQEHPGKHGSRLYFSGRQLLRYRDDPDRMKRREGLLRGPKPPSPLGQETEREYWLESNGMATKLRYAEKSNIDRQHGEFFNARQAAKEMGITVGSVHSLRRRGRLNGYQKPREKEDGVGQMWWFYRKDDVYNLLADTEYVKLHKRCQAAKLRSMGRWIPETEPDC